MSDGTRRDNRTGKEGPSLAEAVQEVQGVFPDDASLQHAMGQLTLNGFDRADLSLPHEQAGQLQTPNEGADNPVDQIDKTQLRTMGTGMAGYAGAAAAAGATLATGGAAGVALAAAAALGAGSALTANVAGRAADKAGKDERDERGEAGGLILAVRIGEPDQVGQVSEIMNKAGATTVTPVSRGGDLKTSGVSAASWTGE